MSFIISFNMTPFILVTKSKILNFYRLKYLLPFVINNNIFSPPRSGIFINIIHIKISSLLRLEEVLRYSSGPKKLYGC